MKIKIAHIQLLPLLTGVQRVSLDELNRLDRDKFTPYMICQQSGLMTDECENNNITCLYSPTLVRKISPLKDLQAFWSLYRLFRQNKFDIVHTHSSKTGVIGRLAAKLAGVPMIVHTVHGFAFPAAKNKFEKNIFLIMEWLGTKCSDKIICLHEADKRIAIDKLGAKDSQLAILANGVDTMKFSPALVDEKKNIREELGLPVNATVIGMVGRLWKQKNPHALVNVALSILEKRNDVHFVFIGDGEFKTSLIQQVKNKDKEEYIHFLGWRNDSERILKSFDIFTLPSLWEGMPLAILEAQATGLPCVVSNIQGNNILVNDHNGLLIDLDKSDSYIRQLLMLIDNASLRNKLGGAGLESILSSHDINKRINKLSSLYLNHFKK